LGSEFGGKAHRLPTGSDEGGSRHAGVLAVVGDHAATEDQAMTFRGAEQPFGTPWGEILIRKANGIADGRAEE
jgi:hypothetical protein